MKRTAKIIFILVVLAALIGGAVFARSIINGDKTPVVFEIKDGSSGRAVAENLHARGLIKSPLFFRVILKLGYGADALKSGKFDLNKSMSSFAIISCVTSGKCIHYEKVTIPEGWRIEEIGEALALHEITDSPEFVRLAKEQNLEGYLYPSTYMFTQNMPAQRVINAMLDAYNKNIKPLFDKNDAGKLTELQVLTIASIVEREAVVHDERPKIAAVYLNRVKKNMRLEADPTVQYAIGFYAGEGRYWKKGLTRDDLSNVSSPYNTYLHGGIPPGPICNPSKASVEAVLNQEQDFNALFFVAENDTGRHLFSRTYYEHVQNIRKVRAERNNKK